MSTEPEETVPAATEVDPPASPAPTAPADPPAEASEAPPAGVWPETWRQELTGGEEKELKRLERAGINSPADAYRKYRDLENSLNSGDYKKVADLQLPENATEAQIASYRKANGIPDEPSGYYDKLSEGLVIGDEDKPIVEDFLKAAHEKNASPEFIDTALQWYYSEMQQRAEALAVEDTRFNEANDEELREEWGPDYRPNQNAIKAFRDQMPEGLGQMIEGARLGDGQPFLGSAAVQRWMLAMAQQTNPMGIPLPGVSGDITNIETRISDIEKTMTTDRKAYNSNLKMQEEYRNLLAARERMKT